MGKTGFVVCGLLGGLVLLGCSSDGAMSADSVQALQAEAKQGVPKNLAPLSAEQAQAGTKMMGGKKGP